MVDPDELIVAPATAAGPGLRSIVRLAGVGLDALLGRLFLSPRDLPGAAAAIPATFHPDSLGREWGALPVTILRWPGPAGPVGGPIAEIQLPCSRFVVDAVVAAACAAGARLARGGEFTLRAFLAGKLDLIQAEAVLAVVDSRTPGELSAALDRMAGGAGRELARLRDRLLDLAADVDAAIDFADEQGTGHAGAVPFWAGIAARLAEIGAQADRVAAAVQSRDGGARAALPRVVIAGPPNIGKSTLFNALVGRAQSLVADEPGTTRDWLEAPMRGRAGAGEAEWILVDTAGVGPAPPPGGAVPNEPDREAGRRAAEETRLAHVVLRCRDAATASPHDPSVCGAAAGAVMIDVLTRCDRLGPGEVPAGTIATSARSGAGIDRLAAAVADAAAGVAREGAGERLHAGLTRCRGAVDEGLRIATSPAGADEALLAEALLGAVDALDEIVGATMGNDLLDRIFSRHCIGK